MPQESGEPGVLRVGEFNRRMKRVIDGTLVDFWVEGETTDTKLVPSGHLYFTLKDEEEDSKLPCVIFKGNLQRSRVNVRDGMRLRVRGKPSYYSPQGKFQFMLDILRPAGRGALLEALERLKEKLRADGLFDLQRKRPIPRDPRIIGVVTSAAGAAIHDIVEVAFQRGRARILLASAVVQGADAPRSLMEALSRLERVRGVDVIILGRGGGSADDLMAFNDEALTRRVAACRVPIISAVGHEVDISLTDLVADLRAATPSQAAELVVPSFTDRLRLLRDLDENLGRVIRTSLKRKRLELSQYRLRLQDPRARLGDQRQRIDELSMRLQELIRARLSQEHRQLSQLDHRLSLHHPSAIMERFRGALSTLMARASAAIQRRLQTQREALSALSERPLTTLRQRLQKQHEILAAHASSLHALSPLQVLGRGYSIAMHLDGRPIVRAKELPPGASFRLQLHEGALLARVEPPEPPLPTPE